MDVVHVGFRVSGLGVGAMAFEGLGRGFTVEGLGAKGLTRG